MGFAITVAIVYLSFFLDNLLLTVVVPIIPDFLFSADTAPRKLMGTNESLLLLESELEALGNENGKVGLLLSSKAIVQLLLNPVIGYLSRFTGYTVPLFVGTINLLVSSLLYAIGESYASLLLARSLQGVASSCIGVSGMCLVAENCQSEETRSRIMGVVLGSVALGVLMGYPFGGFLYDFLGKMAPFIGIAFLALINIGFQLAKLDLKIKQEKAVPESGCSGLLSDGLVLLTAGAIFLSSSVMAILEPCLPIWLMSSIKPEKWQLGTVFIPDSLGYLIGTNCFGVISYKLGRWRVSIAAMIVVGVSAFMVPAAKSVWRLALPHFGLGLGIGVVDSALVPLLATLVDVKHNAHYAAIYAVQQTAVGLAYALGPMIGGEMVNAIGFPWLMRVMGIINVIYSPMLVLLAQQNYHQQENGLMNGGLSVNYKAMEEQRITSSYERLYD